MASALDEFLRKWDADLKPASTTPVVQPTEIARLPKPRPSAEVIAAEEEVVEEPIGTFDVDKWADSLLARSAGAGVQGADSSPGESRGTAEGGTGAGAGAAPASHLDRKTLLS
jgi:hypothetical protein